MTVLAPGESGSANESCGVGPAAPGVHEFLRALAKAVYQGRVYPPGSPFIAEAMEAAWQRLTGLPVSDVLELRVAERNLVCEEIAVGRGTLIERELVRPLRRASVGCVRIDLDAGLQDLWQFAEGLLSISLGETSDLAGALAERGVDRVALEVATTLTIVDSPDAVLESAALRRERERRASTEADGIRRYLYPPDRCWIRVHPASAVTDVSLQELALLIGDPVRLADILVTLSGDDRSTESRAALERCFGDLSTLFASLEPHVGRTMFGRLAQAVLQMEESSRSRLLKRTVLPALFEGRADALILRDFPDVDLADALCLLLDLETAAPEVLGIALRKLDLPEQRHDEMLPLLGERVRTRDASRSPSGPASPLDSYAQRLVRVQADHVNFQDFAAFDVSLDATALQALEQLHETVAQTDWLQQQLGCLSALVRLESRPDAVEPFLHSITEVLATLERQYQHQAVADGLGVLSRTAASLRSRRPLIARSIDAALLGYSTKARAAWLARQYADDQFRPVVDAYVSALGPALAPAFAELLDDRGYRIDHRALAELISDHAVALAPGLVQHLGRAGASTTRSIVRALGRAGAGYEAVLGEQLRHDDPAIGRDALQSLVKIGTPGAAAFVALALSDSREAFRAAAADALSRFPPAVVASQLRAVLGNSDFVTSHPEIVLQLLRRVQASTASGLRAELRGLTLLRRRFWRSTFRRVASKAEELLAS